MKFLSFGITLFVASNCAAQNNYRNQIELNSLSYRGWISSDSYWEIYKPQGISYTRIDSGFNLKFSANYVNYSGVKDGSHCYDCYYGPESLRGLELKSGVQKIYGKKKWNLIMGMDLVYGITRVREDYQGGFSGGGFRSDTKYISFGVNPYLGAGFNLNKRWQLKLESGCSYRNIQSEDRVNLFKNNFMDFMLLPIQCLGIGFKF
ncbi:MAG: hypothetical protein KG003_12470 [Bacteroidetes bacterium]|nr:hypothetical protein [Bacteroidota bacterium]